MKVYDKLLKPIKEVKDVYKRQLKFSCVIVCLLPFVFNINIWCFEIYFKFNTLAIKHMFNINIWCFEIIYKVVY